MSPGSARPPRSVNTWSLMASKLIVTQTSAHRWLLPSRRQRNPSPNQSQWAEDASNGPHYRTPSRTYSSLTRNFCDDRGRNTRCRTTWHAPVHFAVHTRPVLHFPATTDNFTGQLCGDSDLIIYN